MADRNDMEQKLLDMYKEIHLGDCDECATCNDKNKNLSKPVGCWLIGKKFKKQQKRILFVGKNARGFHDNDNKGEGKYLDVFDCARSLWSESWAYWSYTAEIVRNYFHEDSPEYISFTNLIKCNNSDGRDTTSDSMKEQCIKKKKVLKKEILIIEPTHIIFYTAKDYDKYFFPHVFDEFTPINKTTNKTTKLIGEKNMPWLEATAKIDKYDFHVLRVGHPERKKKEDFVNAILDWLNKQ